jgi:uncharacterized protein
LKVPGERPHLPRQAAIDAYGGGGFRFAGMSHQGSLLSLPSGIWAWPINDPAQLSEELLDQILVEADAIDLLVLGTGRNPFMIAEALRWRLRDHAIVLDVMPTGAAVRTYNILFGEGRRVAAGLIAVA